MPGTWGFKGKFTAALEFPAGAAEDVAPSRRGRLRYNEVTDAFEMSTNGAAYVEVGSSASGGGWVDSGTTVRLETVTDQVVIGAAAPSTTEALRVVGDVLLEGLVTTEMAAAQSVAMLWEVGGVDQYLEVDTRVGQERILLVPNVSAAAEVAVGGNGIQTPHVFLSILGADPPQPVGRVVLYAKDVGGGVGMLFYRSNDGTVVGPLAA